MGEVCHDQRSIAINAGGVRAENIGLSRAAHRGVIFY
jgi:hypothetical protein